MDIKNSYMPDLERRVEASLEAEPPGVLVFALMRCYLPQGRAEGLWFTISPHGATLRRSAYLVGGTDPAPVREYADPAAAQRLRLLLATLQSTVAVSSPSGWYAEAVAGSAEGLRRYWFSDESAQAHVIEQLFDLLPAPVARSG
jgi:hypothetical protein